MNPPAEVAPDQMKKKELSREEASVLLTKAELYLQTGKYQKAAQEFETIRKLDPKQAIYFQMGEAYRKSADQENDMVKQKKFIQKAIDAYKRAKEPKAKAYLEELKERLQG